MSDLTRDQKAIKALTRYLTDECGGSTACSQLLGGKSASLISCYGNQDDPSDKPRFMPLDDIATLEHYAGRSIVGAWLVERAAGNPDRSRHLLSPVDMATVAKESSEVLSSLAEGFADQRFCAADRHRAAKELRDLIKVSQQMLEACEVTE